MFRYVYSWFKDYKEKRLREHKGKQVSHLASLVLRKYKIALIDLFEASGPQKRRLILLKIKGGNIWSTRQFNKILAKVVAKHPLLLYEDCTKLIDYSLLKTDFTDWNKNFFLPRIRAREA
jgi:hypothetical protein